MALTGLFLITFLVVHVSVNAVFLKMHLIALTMAICSIGPLSLWQGIVVIRIMEIVLFAGFFIHIIQGLAVEFQNQGKAKNWLRSRSWATVAANGIAVYGIARNYPVTLFTSSLVAFLDPFKIHACWHRRADPVIKWIYRA
jgi:succinate dehydrogenase / fumarate reductase cytochrome b subunit